MMMGTWESKPQKRKNTARADRQAEKRAEARVMVVVWAVILLGFVFPQEQFLFIPATPSAAVIHAVAGAILP